MALLTSKEIGAALRRPECRSKISVTRTYSPRWKMAGEWSDDRGTSNVRKILLYSHQTAHLSFSRERLFCFVIEYTLHS